LPSKAGQKPIALHPTLRHITGQKKLTNKIILDTDVRAEVANTSPQRRQIPSFRGSARGGLVPPEAAVFTLADALLDLGAAGFAAGIGWLLPEAAAFALPHALFASRSGSAILTTARRFCAAS
jgi:hypothetical protein